MHQHATNSPQQHTTFHHNPPQQRHFNKRIPPKSHATIHHKNIQLVATTTTTTTSYLFQPYRHLPPQDSTSSPPSASGSSMETSAWRSECSRKRWWPGVASQARTRMALWSVPKPRHPPVQKEHSSTQIPISKRNKSSTLPTAIQTTIQTATQTTTLQKHEEPKELRGTFPVTPPPWQSGTMPSTRLCPSWVSIQPHFLKWAFKKYILRKV